VPVAKGLEVDALKAVDEALSGLEDGAAQERVLRWAWAKYCTKPSPNADEDHSTKPSVRDRKATKKKTGTKSAKVKLKLSLVKDLNLKPKGKKSFEAFVAEKQPVTQEQQCTVSVYYLAHELALPAVTASHVLTCFKSIGWRLPASLPNRLHFTASVKGWLDTSNSENITVTAMGENLVVHDLPAKPKPQGINKK